MTAKEPLTGNPAKLAARARLAGFDVRHGIEGGTTIVMASRSGTRRGMSAFRVVWRAGHGPEGAIVYAGWWPMPMGYTAILAELDASLAPSPA
jgi:hypothetical protein